MVNNINRLLKNVLYYGKEENLPEQIELHAGSLAMIFEQSALRHIRLGNHEIIRSIYMAVRDKDWGTITPVLSISKINVKEKAFSISFDAKNKEGEIDFFWEGHIIGDEDGTIKFIMNGKARSTFLKNRIGFCVLYPIKEYKGKLCSVEQVNGQVVKGVFPEYISPHEPFTDIKIIRHHVLQNVEVRFSGEVFEMEDQRNWTDASYKIYCTPLRLPYPVTVEEGTSVNQSVTFVLKGKAPEVKTECSSITFTLEKNDCYQPLPAIGCGIPSYGQQLSQRECERLKAINLSHLRVDIEPWKSEYLDVLARGREESGHIGTPLEMVIHFTDNIEEEVRKLEKYFSRERPKIQSFIVFNTGEIVTSSQTIEIIHSKLKKIYPQTPIGGGTNAFFAELNRNRPPSGKFDFVTYTINPQVHAFDNLSLVENLSAQAETVTSARQFLGDIPIHVSPVTLKPRLKLNIINKEAETRTTELSPDVDERQMLLFGAVWTTGSLKYLSEKGVESVTYFETTGMLGIMEREGDSRVPRRFKSFPGSVFPMYHVFADIGEFRLGKVIPSLSSDPLKIDGIALVMDRKIRIILANMTPCTQEVDLHNLGDYVLLRYLDEINCEYAMKYPEAYREKKFEKKYINNKKLRFRLLPYGVLRIDN